jgi:hypothetical protein
MRILSNAISLPPFPRPLLGKGDEREGNDCEKQRLEPSGPMTLFRLTYLGRVTFATRAFIQYTYILPHNAIQTFVPPLLTLPPFSFVFKQGRSGVIENGMTTRFCYTYNITIDWEGRGELGRGHEEQQGVPLATTVV